MPEGAMADPGGAAAGAGPDLGGMLMSVVQTAGGNAAAAEIAAAEDGASRGTNADSVQGEVETATDGR